MARGVDEKETGDREGLSFDEIAAHLEDGREGDLRGSDVLRDAAGLAAGNAGPANSIQESRLAMVHVA